MLLLAAAAWQPEARAGVTLEDRPLLATPLVCGVIGLGIFTYDHFHSLNIVAASLAGATIIAVILRTGMAFRENAQILELMREHAVTDALTELGNRRRLVAELDRVLEAGVVAEPGLLVIYDLDGFKFYNDTFGHPAGDALLARLAAALERVVEPVGFAYRLGGDEFCALVDVPPPEIEAFCEATVAALSEIGDGFAVSSSYGAVFLPDEATTPSDALRLADQRLYAQKRERSGRPTAHEVLLEALYERSPGLRDHVENVAASAVAVGASLGMRGEDIEELRLAARLHDIGKLAIPDAVLQKPGPLDVTEWAFVKEHAVIGERILSTAPGWKWVGTIVRATHERWDGAGYPDGLVGTEIPLASRIIAVCDAFSALTSVRPYRLPVARDQALDELRRCSGSQFDPDVVAAFCTAVRFSASKPWSAAAAA